MDIGLSISATEIWWSVIYSYSATLIFRTLQHFSIADLYAIDLADEILRKKKLQKKCIFTTRKRRQKSKNIEKTMDVSQNQCIEKYR